jgi:hypothetical protein
LEGFATAASFTDPMSYAGSFGPAVCLVPIALFAWLATRAREQPTAGRPGSVIFPTTVIAALGILAPVHLAHQLFGPPWLFSHRHGLPLILLITTSLAYLGAAGRPLRIAAVVLTAVSAVLGAVNIGEMTRSPAAVPLSRSEWELGDWLDSLPSGTTALTTRAQALSLVTKAGLHWTACGDTPANTLAFVHHADVRLVIAYADDLGCSFLKVPTGAFHVVRVFDDGARRLTIFAPGDLGPTEPGAGALP